MIDFYKYLGIPINASQSEIKRAYINRIEAIEKSNFDSKTKKYKKRLTSLAFNTIKNRESRKDYDAIITISKLMENDSIVDLKALKKLKDKEEFDTGFRDIYIKNIEAGIEEREAIKAIGDNRHKSQYLAYDELVDIKVLFMNRIKFRLIPLAILTFIIYDIAMAYKEYKILTSLSVLTTVAFLIYVAYILAIALVMFSDYKSRHKDDLAPCQKQDHHYITK